MKSPQTDVQLLKDLNRVRDSGEVGGFGRYVLGRAYHAILKGETVEAREAIMEECATECDEWATVCERLMPSRFRPLARARRQGEIFAYRNAAAALRNLET